MSRLGAMEGMTLLGMGRALPPRKVDNALLLSMAAETSMTPEALQLATGVETRYWCHAVGDPVDHGEPNSLDLAIAAGRAALEQAKIAPDAIAGLVMVTTTAPYASVNTGNHVAKALGLSGFSMELKAGCAGGIYGLAVAASLLSLGAGPILLVAAEAWSKLAPPGLTGLMAVAGDGAAAAVLGRGGGAFLGGALHTDPAHAGAMMPPGQYPPTMQALAEDQYRLRVTEDVGAVIRDFYPRIFEELLAATGLERDQLDRIIFHQPSAPIVRRAVRDCRVPPERVYHTLARYGNASSASVLLSLHDARQEGLLKAGDRVALVAVGGGVAAAGAVLRC